MAAELLPYLYEIFPEEAFPLGAWPLVLGESPFEKPSARPSIYSSLFPDRLSYVYNMVPDGMGSLERVNLYSNVPCRYESRVAFQYNEILLDEKFIGTFFVPPEYCSISLGCILIYKNTDYVVKQRRALAPLIGGIQAVQLRVINDETAPVIIDTSPLGTRSMLSPLFPNTIDSIETTSRDGAGTITQTQVYSNVPCRYIEIAVLQYKELLRNEQFTGTFVVPPGYNSLAMEQVIIYQGETYIIKDCQVLKPLIGPVQGIQLKVINANL